MASSSKVTSLSEVPVSVLARQLTLKDLAFLKAIQTPFVVIIWASSPNIIVPLPFKFSFFSEFCGSNGQVAWMKPNKQEISPNILKSIVHANHVRKYLFQHISWTFNKFNLRCEDRSLFYSCFVNFDLYFQVSPCLL